MTLELTEELGKTLGPEQLKLSLALGLYVAGLVSMGKAAEMAGQPRLAFNACWPSGRFR